MNARPELADHPARVLIVDDERANRQLLEVMLTSEGYLFQSASSGEEALAMVAKEAPDIILLDVMMPGMDGYQVAAKLKGSLATKNIPVVMVTALDERDARMLGLSAGAEDFLTKPVDRAELWLRVRNLLRLKAYGDYHDKYSRMLEGEVGSRTAELVESERLYRSTFDAAPVGIAHVGLDGKWVRVNQRLGDLLGYSTEELHRASVQVLVQPDIEPGESEAVQKMAAGTLERHAVDEKRLVHKDGRFVWVRVNTSVHRDGEGRLQHFISVFEDITERRALEAKIRQASKMDAIGRLASGVAHDFNNLLTVILGFAELVTADEAIPSQHRTDLNEIIKAARRASGLTKQLLAFSRQRVLRTTPLDVNRLITDMTAMLGRLIGENIDVALVLSEDLSMALADRSQLEQVVMNLVVNARDAMPDGGRVTIETKDVRLEETAFHDQIVAEGHYVMLAITDTGCGMTREVQQRLFEPFFTTKESGKGTGLGLSTTYGIVKQSKGYIWVYSEPGRGTTFRVYLPRSIEAVEASAIGGAAAAPGKAVTETVLIVEDEPGVRHLARRILSAAGYQVLEAENGNDAEKLFALHSEKIDLIVTDVMMPSCGGPELIARLQTRAPELRVLFMSGHGEQAELYKARLDHGAQFIQKPFTIVELVREVRNALDRSGAGIGSLPRSLVSKSPV